MKPKYEKPVARDFSSFVLGATGQVPPFPFPGADPNGNGIGGDEIQSCLSGMFAGPCTTGTGNQTGQCGTGPGVGLTGGESCTGGTFATSCAAFGQFAAGPACTDGYQVKVT